MTSESLFHLPTFLLFDDKLDVCERFFVIAVTALAIVPRMPLDAPWTIGGKLSYHFRKLLLVIFAIYMGRHLFFPTLLKAGIPKAFSIGLMALESVLLSFLCLLTPYLLRVWLSGRVNVGRRPGKALEGWIQVT